MRHPVEIGQPRINLWTATIGPVEYGYSGRKDEPMPTRREQISIINLHIDAAEQHIVNQERLISRLIFVGSATEQAREILKVMHECLQTHREHKKHLCAEDDTDEAIRQLVTDSKFPIR